MFHRFNAPFVFHTAVNDHEQIKQLILPELVDNLKPELFDAQKMTYTCYNKEVDIGFNLPLNVIQKIIFDPFQSLASEYAFNPPIKNAILQGLWWNYYMPGGHTHKHFHREDDYSFIYLLHSTEENTTVFELSGEFHTTEHISEGNVIIFPSFLTHWARSCNNERAVIVGNLTVER